MSYNRARLPRSAEQTRRCHIIVRMTPDHMFIQRLRSSDVFFRYCAVVVGLFEDDDKTDHPTLWFVFAPLFFVIIIFTRCTHCVLRFPVPVLYLRLLLPLHSWRRRGIIYRLSVFIQQKKKTSRCAIVVVAGWPNVPIIPLRRCPRHRHLTSAPAAHPGRQAEFQETSRYHSRYEHTHVNPEPQRIRWVACKNCSMGTSFFGNIPLWKRRKMNARDHYAFFCVSVSYSRTLWRKQVFLLSDIISPAA